MAELGEPVAGETGLVPEALEEIAGGAGLAGGVFPAREAMARKSARVAPGMSAPDAAMAARRVPGVMATGWASATPRPGL